MAKTIVEPIAKITEIYEFEILNSPPKVFVRGAVECCLIFNICKYVYKPCRMLLLVGDYFIEHISQLSCGQ